MEAPSHTALAERMQQHCSDHSSESSQVTACIAHRIIVAILTAWLQVFRTEIAPIESAKMVVSGAPRGACAAGTRGVSFPAKWGKA